MAKPRVLTLDLEIAREVEEVGGWDAARSGAAGISSMVIYDTRSERYHIYDEWTLDRAVSHLNSADLLVSFNGLGFDIPVIEGVFGATIDAVEHYDILAQVWSAVGKQKGFRLGEICERTLGEHKINNGESAPRLFKAGRIAELVDYNLHDVWLTRKLYNHILKYQTILGPTGEPVEMPPPPRRTNGSLYRA